jgi:thiol-disulfide isomerase/thioredoxin
LVNDSILFFNYNNHHGSLIIPSAIADFDSPIDENGLPTGTFAYELIPLFVGDSLYLEDILKDTIHKKCSSKTIGNTVLIESSTQNAYAIDSLIEFISSKDFICYNRLSKKIYFELSIGNFSIAGLPFTQRDLKTYSYSSTDNCSVENYEPLIQTANKAEIEKNSNSLKNSFNLIPNFQYSDLEDNSLESNNIKEKIVLLEFWYISCAPCLKNMQHLNLLFEKYKSQKIKFLVLNDADLDVEKIKKIRNKYSLKYEVYYRGESLKKELGIQAHPHTIIYNTQTSKIIYEAKGTGNKYVEEISSVLDSLLQIK